MATLKDVAKLACVDVSTVSRALNNTSYVHPDTKARIYAAVKELNYQPNLIAKSLRQGKRRTVGIVVPALQLSLFAELLQGAEQELRRRGYAALVCLTGDNPQTERDCLTRLRNGLADGVILAPTGKNLRLLRDIHASGIAMVQIVREQEPSISSVVADYASCGYQGVKYLASRGCKSIGLINGSTALAPYRDRYVGYRRALDELGLPELSVISMQPNNSFEYGYQCTNELLDQWPELDAIMAAVDIHGLGALRALKERGIRVPQQMRLLSLTGHSIGGLLETAMTAIEIPAQEMGRKAASMLLDECDAPEGCKPSVQHLKFDASLTVREST
ncbi:MAG: LacI family DNA-binding transcriptional regulator [Faecalibacterium sp.]